MTTIVLSVVGKVAEVKTVFLGAQKDGLDRWAIRITYDNADIVFAGTEEKLGPLAKLLDKPAASLDDDA